MKIYEVSFAKSVHMSTCALKVHCNGGILHLPLTVVQFRCTFIASALKPKKIISLWGKCDACKVSSHCYWKGKLAVQGTQIINATYWLS